MTTSQESGSSEGLVVLTRFCISPPLLYSLSLIAVVQAAAAVGEKQQRAAVISMMLAMERKMRRKLLMGLS